MTAQAFDDRIERLIQGPRYPQKAFTPGEADYENVYAMAACLRTRLAESVPDGQPVCLCAEDKAVTAAALLAALAGGPTLVLPYALGADVLADLQGLTGYTHAITDGPRHLPPGVQRLTPSDRGPTWSYPPEEDRPGPEAVWAHLFTGGSTGTPRIWTKTVRNLMAEAFHIVDKFGIQSADRLVATVWPGHIYGLLYAVLAPLAASASVATEMPAFPSEIEALVEREKATILISVPAHFHALNSLPIRMDSLRLAFSSAGMLADEDAHAFTRQTGVGIMEIYGSTETGGVASRIRAAGETDFRSFDAVEFEIRNKAVFVRSDYLSPDLPLSERGFFRMGDRALPTSGRCFQLLGRADGIVKVGGKRVDLEAVRQVLKTHPRVREAVAIALPVGRARENQIVALVEGELDTAELSDGLSTALEPYAQPRRIKVVDKIPASAAGKFDHNTIAAHFRDD